MRLVTSLTGVVTVATLTLAAAGPSVPQPGQATLRITSPTRDAVLSGPTRLEVLIEPAASAASVQTVTYTVDGRLACTVEQPPFACTWDSGDIVRGHHIRVVATLAGGGRLTDNLHTKDLGFTERIRTDAVLVPVIVTRDGEFVRGLKKQDFEIVEDGVVQSVASLASEDAPLDLILAIDISGSMEQSLGNVKTAVKQLLSKLRLGDAATLVGFNDTMFLAAEREKDQQARERAVELLTAWGGTALYDATVRAIDLVGREWGRKGIVIFSDGDDHNSLTPRDAAAARVQASDAMLYTIGFGAGSAIPTLRTNLETFARSTGGRAFFPTAHAGARRGVRSHHQRTGQSVRAVVLLDQRGAEQSLAQHQGARAVRQVRHPRAAGIPGVQPAAIREVVMRRVNGIMVAGAITALCTGGGPRLAAQQAGAEQTPAFRSGIEVVSVDVAVLDRQGQPRRGLAPGDFAVTVGGRPRRVVSAEFIERAAAAPAPAPARPETSLVSTNEGGGSGRLFAFIVDQNTLDPGSARRVGAATGPFFSRLTFADRSALMVMPLGPTVSFTWAHDRVKEGLQRVTGMGRFAPGWEYGSLAEARDIANRSQFALRSLGERQCGSISAGGGGAAPVGPTPAAPTAPSGGPPGPPSGGSPGGGGGTPEGGATPAAPGSAPAGGGGGGASGRSGNPSGGFDMSMCARDLQMQAESAWRMAQNNSLASISSLRQFLAALANVRGDKTVVLISGGWPLDEREETSLIGTVAAEAAAARATVHSVFVPTSLFSADRRVMTSTPAADTFLYSGPLETLAAMSGGSSYRAEAGADAVFERMGRELSGYYRIGIEKEAGDADGKGRRMKVQVPRESLTVRAREIFDVRTYEDRDRAARLASAVDGPITANDIGLRLTSYLSADPDNSARRRLILIGEASRTGAGEATLRMVVSDLTGRKVTGGEATLAHDGVAILPFSTNVTVPPGSYIVRVGVMDAGGRIGSVDHRVDVRDVSLGDLTATGPVLVRVPSGALGDPSLALDSVGQDERLAVEIDLEGEKGRLEGTTVEFQIAATADGPVLLRSAAVLAAGPRAGSMLAQGVADMRVLPPGPYVLSAKVTSGSESLGDLQRPFVVTTSARSATAPAGAPIVASTGSLAASSRAVSRLPVVTVAPFALDQVLAAPVLGAFLDRVALRPDASLPGVRELLTRVRTSGLDGVVVSDAQAAVAPTAAFLKGLQPARRPQDRGGRRRIPRRDARVGGLLPRDGLSGCRAMPPGGKTRKRPRCGGRR